MHNPQLHQVDYNSKLVVGWALSVFIHFVLVLVLIGLMKYPLFSYNPQVHLQSIPSIIEITLVPDFIATMENEQKIESQIKPDVPDVIEQDQDAKTIKIPDPAVDNAIKAAVTKSPAPERYEQILARHFINALPNNIKQIRQNSAVDVWIRINHKGEIEDYGFHPEPQDAQLKAMLEVAISNASPVPLPSQETFTSGYAQYMLPLLLRK